MKKILHLFRSSQFTEGYIKCINKYNLSYYHYFWVYGFNFDISNYCSEKNVRFISNIYIELRKPKVEYYFENFDIIIYHRVFENDVIRFLYNNKTLLRKTFLMFLGGDIPLSGTEEQKEMKWTVVNQAAGIITIIESDYKKIVENYHPIGIAFCIHYLDEKNGI